MLAPGILDSILAWLTGTPMPSPPAALHVSLHNSAVPSAGNEISSAVGGRVLIAGSVFAGPRDSTGPYAGRELYSQEAVVFGNAQSDITVSSFAIWDAATAGNLIITGDVIPDVALLTGDAVIFSSGDLIIRIGQGVL